MVRFNVQRFEDDFKGGLVNAYTELVDDKTTQRVRIGDLGCDIQLLVLNHGTDDEPHLISDVFTHEDWVDLQADKKRQELPRQYSISERRAAHELRLKYPTLVGATSIDIANRVLGGNAVCQNPENGDILVRRKWEPNFPADKPFALLHGHACRNRFKPDMDSFYQGKDKASITVPVTIGVGLNYFSRVINYVTFSLGAEGLTESGKIVNEGDNHASIAFGRHPSFRVGAEGLDDHVLVMDVEGALGVYDNLTLNGEIVSVEKTIFYDLQGSRKLERISLSGSRGIDKTFVLGAKKDVLVENTKTGYGLRIGAEDKYTRHCTVWNNALREAVLRLQYAHTAVEHLAGTIGGTFDLPDRMDFKIIKERGLTQLVLAPGDFIEYVRTYRGYKK